MSKKSLLSLFFLMPVTTLVGCASGTHDYVEGSYIDATGVVRQRDAAVKAKSEAIYSYLVGEVSLDKGDVKLGLASLERAANLVPSPVPEISSRVAALHLERREIDDAIKAYEELRSINPRDADTIIPLAGLYEVVGKYQRAEELYTSVPPGSLRAAEAQVLKAALLGKTNGPEFRTRELESAAKKHPKDLMTLLLLGLSYEDQGDLKSAESAIEKAVKLDDKRVGPYVELLRIQVQEKKFDDAVTTSKEILKLEPSNLLATRVIQGASSGALALEAASFRLPPRHATDTIGTRLFIAMSEIEKSEFVYASQHLTILIAMDPSDTQVRMYLATVFSGLGNKSEAIKELDAIPPTARNYVRARMLAAIIAKSDGDEAGAERITREAFAVSPEDPYVRGFLIDQLKEQGKYGEAVSLMEDMVEKDPKNEKLLFSYANLLHDKGDRKAAIEVIESVITLNPHNDEALNYAAYAIAEDGGDLSRAEEYIRTAIDKEPQNGYYLDTLGWILFKKGDYESSADYLEQATKFVPLDPIILLHEAHAYKKLGRDEELAKLVEQSIEQLEEKNPEEKEDSEKRVAIMELKGMMQGLKKSRPELFNKKYPMVSGK